MVFVRLPCVYLRSQKSAGMAKLVDAPDLGSGAVRHGGSSPSIRTFIFLIHFKRFHGRFIYKYRSPPGCCDR